MTDTVRIYINRKDDFRAPNVTLNVMVDKKEMCRVGPNGSGQFDVESGPHEVEVKVINGIRTTKTLDLQQGGLIKITTKLGKIDFTMDKVKFL